MDQPSRSRSRSRSQEKDREKDKAITYTILKVGNPIPDQEVRTQFCLFGEVVRIQNYGGNPQKVIVDLKINRPTTSEQLLAYFERNFRNSGWNVQETPVEIFQRIGQGVSYIPHPGMVYPDGSFSGRQPSFLGQIGPQASGRFPQKSGMVVFVDKVFAF